MISDADIRTAMKAFLVSNCGISASAIIMGQGNRAPSPKGGFVEMTFMLSERSATNIHEEEGELGQDAEVAEFSVSTTMPSEGTMQLDFYGPSAWTWAHVAALKLRDEIGCTFLAPRGVQPLYCNDPRNLTGISGEGQHQARWMLEARIAFNPSITANVDFFTNVDLHTKPEL